MSLKIFIKIQFVTDFETDSSKRFRAVLSNVFELLTWRHNFPLGKHNIGYCERAVKCSVQLYAQFDYVHIIVISSVY